MKEYYPRDVYLVKLNNGKQIIVKTRFDVLNELWMDDVITEYNALRTFKIDNKKEMEELCKRF